MANLAIQSLTLLILAAGSTGSDVPAESAVSGMDIRINGKIVEGRYYEPLGRFSIEIPPLVKPGAVIRGGFDERGGTIGFTDDIGTFIRVDVMTALDAKGRSVMNDPDWRVPLDKNREYFGKLAPPRVMNVLKQYAPSKKEQGHGEG